MRIKQINPFQILSEFVNFLNFIFANIRGLSERGKWDYGRIDLMNLMKTGYLI